MIFARILATSAQLNEIGIDADLHGLTGVGNRFWPTGYVEVEISREVFGIKFSYEYDIPDKWIHTYSVLLEMKEGTIVRENLMTVKNYTGYCGAEECTYSFPRTVWDSVLAQFKCPRCGWVSKFPESFIKRYRQKWSK